jgi:hypothetical protein
LSIATAQVTPLKAPFPYFGGKSKVAPLVWSRFGDVRNYVEPFAGSLACLLGRPRPFVGSETVNDYDGLIANFWRALKADPEAVAAAADWPVNENDLHARHIWLVERKESLQARLEGSPSYFDAQVAGWWVWGICAWIGSGWCSGKGPWAVVEDDGFRQLVHLGDAGRGVNRKLVHLGDAGRGVNRQLVHLGDAGQEKIERAEASTASAGECAQWSDHIRDVMQGLSDRLRRVRVCCGDWSRVCGPTPTRKMGLTAVFLDPPYADTAKRTADLYREDSLSVAHDVRKWAIANGDDPLMRIALCGYEGEHKMPKRWDCIPWKAKGGYASQARKSANDNCRLERIWFSPHCLSGVIP